MSIVFLHSKIFLNFKPCLVFLLFSYALEPANLEPTLEFANLETKCSEDVKNVFALKGCQRVMWIHMGACHCQICYHTGKCLEKAIAATPKISQKGQLALEFANLETKCSADVKNVFAL